MSVEVDSAVRPVAPCNSVLTHAWRSWRSAAYSSMRKSCSITSASYAVLQEGRLQSTPFAHEPENRNWIVGAIDLEPLHVTSQARQGPKAEQRGVPES